MAPLKRVVIKEELVALTGDYRLSITLQQMIYWSERTSGFGQSGADLDYADAIEKAKKHGLIYKTAEELAKETMMKRFENHHG